MEREIESSSSCGYNEGGVGGASTISLDPLPMSAAEAGRCPPLELVPRLVRAMVKVLLPASNAPRVGRRQVYGTGRGGAFVSFSTSFNIFNPSVLRVVMGLVGNGNIKVKRSKVKR